MAILTKTGKQQLANVFKSFNYFLAWGSGDTAWDATFRYPETTDTALVAELGRRKATLVEFCTPDDAGTISVPSGTYSPSATATYYIHLRFEFQLIDSPEATVREIGVFAHTELNDGVDDSGYITPTDIKSIGDLVMEERFSAVVLKDSTKRAFDIVISI